MKFNFRRAVIGLSAVNTIFAFATAIACAVYGCWGRFALAVAIMCMEVFVIGVLIDD